MLSESIVIDGDVDVNANVDVNVDVAVLLQYADIEEDDDIDSWRIWFDSNRGYRATHFSNSSILYELFLFLPLRYYF